MRVWALLLGAVLPLTAHPIFCQQRKSATCSETAGMGIYSSASYFPETGDVTGYEIALSEPHDGKYRALLFVYEGTANEDAIELRGDIKANVLTLDGTWIESLVAYPSRKESTQSHPVHLSARIAANTLRGKLRIDSASQALEMKRTNRIWLCKKAAE